VSCRLGLRATGDNSGERIAVPAGRRICRQAELITAGWRKLVLTIHPTFSLGWVGTVVAYVALGLDTVAAQDPQTVRAGWIAMELLGWYVIVPLAVAALLTGLVISLGTAWGLFRHYWVLISLTRTVLATGILILHMPSVSTTASVVRGGDSGQIAQLGGDLGHAVGGLVVLLVITVLNVYQPQGLTPYGWRKQQEARALATQRDVVKRKGSLTTS